MRSTGAAHGSAAHNTSGTARRAGDDTAPAHGIRRGRWLTGAETATGDSGRGPGDAASDRGGRGVSYRDDGGAHAAVVGRASDARRGSVRRGVRGAVGRGAGEAAFGTRDALSQQQLVSDFRIKIHPEGN
jgi:hypothetical protein